MKNSIGNSVQLTVFGESHGSMIGVVLDGLAPGLAVNDSFIKKQLSLRRPSLPTDTPRIENDEYQIISGVNNGYTTGSPITIIIPNENINSQSYSSINNFPRPSHADYAAQVKYHGYQDKNGGGHFSGRVTAGIVAVGAICIDALSKWGINISSHILKCAGVKDIDFSKASLIQFLNLQDKLFPVIDNQAADLMQAKILEAKTEGDSLGGIIQTGIFGLPAGLGEPWFDSLESMISKAVFGIGAIKGIEFGAGFGFGEMKGSEANDAFQILNNEIVTKTNNSGGINGGISNGMPVIFNMAVRPTPSISKTQESVDLNTMNNVQLNIKGRHDPAIIRRICIVITSMVAIVLCDVLALRYGTDWIRKC